LARQNEAHNKPAIVVNKNNLLCEVEFWLDELLEGAIALVLLLLVFSSFSPVL